MPGIDRELLKVLHHGSREDRVVLGEILHGQAKIKPYFGYRAVVDFERNVRPLDVIVDPDGIVRRMPLSLPTLSDNSTLHAIPSLALELAHRAGKQDAHQKNWQRQGQAIADPPDRHLSHQRNNSVINLHRRNIDLPTYSLADLYHCARNDERSYFVDHSLKKLFLSAQRSTWKTRFSVLLDLFCLTLHVEGSTAA